MENILLELLANEFVINYNLQISHWNIIGKDFKTIHTFLGELYETSNKDIDDIAEKLRINNFVVNLKQNEINVLSTLTNNVFLSFDSNTIFKKLYDDYSEFTEILSLHLVENKNVFDLSTENYLLNLLETKQKTLWFIKSHI